MLKRILAMVLAICMVLPMTGIGTAAVTLRDDLSGVTLQKKAADKWTGQRVERLFDRLPLSGISTADVGDQEFEESEPNDSFSQANLIYHDYTVYGTIEGDDLDGYVFELDEYSQVTIISACTTDGLVYGILDAETQDVVAESGYLEYDAESGLHLAGLSVELPAGVYCLVFFDYYESSLEYMFYVDISEAEGHVHDYDVSTVEATCTEDGYVVYTCACGDSYMGDEIPALGHDFDNAPIFPHENGVQHCWDCNRCPERRYANCTFNGVVTKEPTATEEGVKTFTCGVCGNSYTESIPMVEEEINEIASGTCGENLTWTLDSKGVLTISGTGAMTDYDSNGPAWAEYVADITDIRIAEGVTFIGGYAFQGCVQVTSIVLPESVTGIGSCVFGYCTALTDVNIPAGVTSISSGLFFECDSLETVEIPAGVTEIGDNAFYGCDRLNGLIIPDGVQTIGQECFGFCTDLTELVIPDSVTKMGNYTFAGCAALKKVTLSNQLKEVPDFCFDGCTSLKTIEIPASVTLIDKYAFSGCGTIDSVKFLGSAPIIAVTAFMDTTATCYYPAGDDTWTEEKLAQYEGTIIWISYETAIITEGECGENVRWSFDAETGVLTISGQGEMIDYANVDGAQPWKRLTNKITEIVVEAGVTHVGNYAFDGLELVKKITLPDTLKTIGTASFRHTGIETLEIPGSVEFIGYYAFGKCYNLTGVTLNEGLEGIGLGAFYECMMLQEITIPGTVTIIEMEAFAYSGLQTVRFEGDAPDIESYVFANVTATVSYPADNATWTEEVRSDYGGTLTWVAEAGTVESVPRIYGAGRVETSFAVADALKETLGIEKFSAILITYGDNFADALAGSYLACEKNAPILLYRPGYEDEILDYVMENLSGNGKIYILGGTAAVPKVMEDTLAGYTVERLAGETRFDTNILILEEAGVSGEEILIATGWEFADSLSASATGLPVLLVNSKTGKLTDSQIAFLKAHADNTYTIIGGKNAVSQELQKTIEGVIGREVCRVYGDWREDTAVEVANTYFDKPDTVLLAFSRNYPDGLCGGPLAHAMGAPLLLINAGKEDAAAEYVKANGIEAGIVLGGTAAVSEKSAQIVFGLE